MSTDTPDISVIIVSFNTCDLLLECLQTLQTQAGGIRYETIVIDNASQDGSADMVEREFPDVQLIRSTENLGFAAANNLGFAQARGHYVVLLNSDAFLKPQALSKALAYMQAGPKNPKIGVGGARLVGPDGTWQPSARMFPNLLNNFITLSGLAAKYPHSRFFGRVDRTWADPDQAAIVDWVPGAFSIMPRHVLEEVGYFDEQFFLYYEEVDLCKRIQAKGYNICYWPDVVVVHLGGESSKTLKELKIYSTGKQISLWQMRSALLFYRKHYGALSAWLWMQMENLWLMLRALKNGWSKQADKQQKAAYSKTMRRLLRQAWHDTQGGRISPPRPW
ncbi:MAG: glycosyltransferase family 2 protein [Candidatus Parabeggiatoa sp. nov. 2]|nr:MAG: glycosyl transferase [Beggiatoa sp. 4572_84]RKZ56925.1 MAG: glycosyltransferase family 2 protein [Gammaproteobacteria bacterium]HEC83939.1 glycosyltransferase family 2 protein [Thioploca sp.]